MSIKNKAAVKLLISPRVQVVWSENTHHPENAQNDHIQRQKMFLNHPNSF